MSRILIIDDDEMFLSALNNILQNEGYTITSTADGPHGIELYRIQRPDLVLLDVGLPTMNGIEVLKRIKHIDPNARVIVVTGYASEEWAKRALQNGAAAFFEKTLDVNRFSETVKSILSSKGYSTKRSIERS